MLDVLIINYCSKNKYLWYYYFLLNLLLGYWTLMVIVRMGRFLENYGFQFMSSSKIFPFGSQYQYFFKKKNLKKRDTIKKSIGILKTIP